jgi:hypothetical protein
VRVEWCVHNEKFGVRDIVKRLREVDDLASQASIPLESARFACLEECHLCCRQPFLLIEHREHRDICTARNAETLWDDVQCWIGENGIDHATDKRGTRGSEEKNP